MDEKTLLKSFLSCHVCLETFNDPVSLSCNHNFCSSCLEKFWQQTKNKNCPICKRKSSKDLGVNFSLKELADSFAGRQTGGSNETEKEVGQLLSTEKQIRAEFNKLHQFLKEEEESRLAALREEEEQKGRSISREVKRIQEQISSLSDSISAVEEDLQKDNMLFLRSYKPSQDRARDQCSASDPQLLSGALIDVAKHLGNLAFRVWEKMTEKVHFSPVILDPNTANPSLHLSDDLTSLSYGNTKQQLPDNPERNLNYVSVFGSEGFISGKHSWEVEVGDHSCWLVGLVKDSVERKDERYPSPNNGIWCLRHGDGKYTTGVSKTITVKASLRGIRVQLDYDRGEVSFYNPEDMTHIYSHRDTFTEKLFPYFSVGKSRDAKTSDIRQRLCFNVFKLTFFSMFAGIFFQDQDCFKSKVHKYKQRNLKTLKIRHI